MKSLHLPSLPGVLSSSSPSSTGECTNKDVKALEIAGSLVCGEGDKEKDQEKDNVEDGGTELESKSILRLRFGSGLRLRL